MKGDTIWRKQELIWLGGTWLHWKKFDPQLAFECLEACGVIRALHFICNEGKQVPAVKFIPGSGPKSFHALQLFRSFDSDFISAFLPSLFGQAEMSGHWFGIFQKYGKKEYAYLRGLAYPSVSIKLEFLSFLGLLVKITRWRTWIKMTHWTKVAQRSGT